MRTILYSISIFIFPLLFSRSSLIIKPGTVLLKEYCCAENKANKNIHLREKEQTEPRKARNSHKWAIGYGIHGFGSKSKNAYIKGIKQVGFGGRVKKEGFLSGWDTVKEPQTKQSVTMRQCFYVEHIINKLFGSGIMYTFYEGAKVEGWKFDRWHIINQSDKGTAYYFYSTIQSNRDEDLPIKGGLGFGAAQIHFRSKIEKWGESDQPAIGPDLSKWAFSSVLFVHSEMKLNRESSI